MLKRKQELQSAKQTAASVNNAILQHNAKLTSPGRHQILITASVYQDVYYIAKPKEHRKMNKVANSRPCIVYVVM